MLFLRSALFNIAFYVNLMFWLALGVPTLMLPRRYFMWILRNWAVSTLWQQKMIAGTDVRWVGLDKVPQGGCIIAAKHQSTWETCALFAVLKDPSFVLKYELRLLPLFGWYTIKAGMIAVRRGRTRRDGLASMSAQAKETMAAGRQLIIFPEGTRRPVGAPPDYKTGAAHIYAATNAPCVPVALNAGVYWPRRAFLRRPGTITVEFMDPIAPGMRPKAFLAELRTRIEKASDRLLLEARRETGT